MGRLAAVMPTYEYICKDCGHAFEIVQSMKDDALTVCPECGGTLRKVFGAPAISFKGSGFYATDHGKKATSGSDRAGSGERTNGEEKRGGGDKRDPSTSDTKKGSKESGPTTSTKDGGSTGSSGGSSSRGPSGGSKDGSTSGGSKEGSSS